MHVYDLQARVLHLLGFAHERLTYRSMRRDFLFTDLSGRVVEKLLALMHDPLDVDDFSIPLPSE